MPTVNLCKNKQAYLLVKQAGTLNVPGVALAE
jgi:hypothetical protein